MRHPLSLSCTQISVSGKTLGKATSTQPPQTFKGMLEGMHHTDAGIISGIILAPKLVSGRV